MNLLHKIDKFFARQHKAVFGLIEPGMERFIITIARYGVVFIAPYTTPIFIYAEYPPGIKFLYFIFAFIWVFFAYCIILDFYNIIKRIMQYYGR